MSKFTGPELGQDKGNGGQSQARRDAIEAALIAGQRRFLGFLISRLGNVDDAMDVLQDFSLRAFKRADDLRDVASVRGWLSRLLATAITDHFRRSTRRRRREVPGDPWGEAADITLPTDTGTDAAVCDCLRDVIGLLPPAQADLLRRIDLEEQPRLAVARALGITEGNLAVRLFRARGKLRDLLVDLCLTCPEHGFLDCACARARARALAAGDIVPGALA